MQNKILSRRNEISLSLKFVDWPIHENPKNKCSMNNNDFAVFCDIIKMKIWS
jgi:hypothetical protein